jgi:hypothetical protein
LLVGFSLPKKFMFHQNIVLKIILIIGVLLLEIYIIEVFKVLTVSVVGWCVLTI